jgi:hypothetical protein
VIAVAEAEWVSVSRPCGELAPAGRSFIAKSSNLVCAIEAMGSVDAGPRDLSISTEQNQTNGVLGQSAIGPGLDPENRFLYPKRDGDGAVDLPIDYPGGVAN